jgi:hypothetical protein
MLLRAIPGVAKLDVNIVRNTIFLFVREGVSPTCSEGEVKCEVMFLLGAVELPLNLD